MFSDIVARIRIACRKPARGFFARGILLFVLVDPVAWKFQLRLSVVLSRVTARRDHYETHKVLHDIQRIELKIQFVSLYVILRKNARSCTELVLIKKSILEVSKSNEAFKCSHYYRLTLN